jgi:hypothetical protein
MELNKHTAGLSLGIIFLLLHVVWFAAVASGYGDSVLHWFERGHFIEMTLNVTSFSVGTAVITLLRAFVAGYIIGFVFAFLYNKFSGGNKN